MTAMDWMFGMIGEAFADMRLPSERHGTVDIPPEQVTALSGDDSLSTEIEISECVISDFNKKLR